MQAHTAYIYAIVDCFKIHSPLVRFPAKDKECHRKYLFPEIIHHPLVPPNLNLVAQFYDSKIVIFFPVETYRLPVTNRGWQSA